MRSSVVAVSIVALALLTSGSAALAQAPAAPAAPAPTRIGFVDVQRVLARASAGVSAREQLEKDKAAMQKDMDGRRVELEKLREELEKKGPLMTADARRDKQEGFERRRRDAARAADDFQKELERKEQLLLQKVLQDLSGVIERVGKQRGYYMVVEKRGAVVLYAAAEADLTDEIIRAYDQELASKGKK
ncbi:MAG: OmpH family outer membrane protein [Deltaproteobacteria bacterium]|nr:OmpH family outer membrane protein [Deltaproteobacteria bacterium]